MGLYLANIGLIVGVLVVLFLVTFGLWEWRWKRLDHASAESIKDAWDAADRLGILIRTEDGRESLPIPGDSALDRAFDRELEEIRSRNRRRQDRIKTLGRALNIATTIIAFIPVGLAIFNLITNNQRQALNFNLAALATLVVTKGGLFLLTMVLIPAAKAIPPAVAGGFAWKKVNEWLDARKKEKPPTT